MARKLSVSTVRMLISEIKKNPVIYDSSNPDFKNPAVKERKWKKLSLMFHVPVPDLKYKWKILRDSYVKYLKLKAAGDPKNNWHLAKEMGFMRKYVKPRTIYPDSSKRALLMPIGDGDDQYFEGSCPQKSDGDTHSDTDVLQNEDFDDSDDDVDEKPLKPSKRKPNKTQYVEIEPVTNDESRVDVKIVQNLDHNELIFVGYAKSMKKFSLERQAQVKMKLAELMMTEELAHLQEMKALGVSNDDEVEEVRTKRKDPLIAKIEPGSGFNSEYLEPDCSTRMSRETVMQM